MNMRSTTLFVLTLLLVSALPGHAAQGLHASSTVVYQPSTALESGGHLAITRSLIQTGGRLFKTDKLFANWSLGLGVTDYDFTMQGVRPWGDIYQGSLGISLLRPLDRKWSLLINPSVATAGEIGAQASETLSYGLLTALNVQAKEGLRLGLGVAAYKNLDENQVVPVIILDWQLHREWRLANPLRAGVTGPAGLELSWQADENWTLAAGGSVRGFRFRLEAENSVPNGIGEEKLVPIWLRLSKQFAQGKLSLYSGAALKGSLKIEDRRGNSVSRSDYDPAPFFALYFSGMF